MELLQPIELLAPMGLEEEFNTVFDVSVDCSKGHVCDKGKVTL
jgi:hypothetical protein